MKKEASKAKSNNAREEAINSIKLYPIGAFALGKYLDGIKVYPNAVNTYNRVNRKVKDLTVEELETIYNNNISPALKARRDRYHAKMKKNG